MFFINNARYLKPGQFIFSFEHFNTRKTAGASALHDEGHHELAQVKFASPLHTAEGVESQVQNNVFASLLYGAGNRLTLMATVPYTFNRISLAGERETTRGLGDPEIMALIRLGTLGGETLSLQAVGGMRAPLGQSDMKNENGLRLEQHLQTGTGAWSALFGVQASQAKGSLPLFFGVNFQVNGTNVHQFQYGNVLRYNFAAQKALASTVDGIAEINGRTAAFDKENGEIDPNSGGTVVYFSPGLRWRTIAGLDLRMQVQIPVVEQLKGEQDEEINFRSGVAWTL
jgi:hypothetical protein